MNPINRSSSPPVVSPTAFVSSAPIRSFLHSPHLSSTSQIRRPRSPQLRNRRLHPFTSTSLPWLSTARANASANASANGTANGTANANGNGKPQTYDQTAPIDYPLGAPGQLPRVAPRYWLHGLISDIKRRLPVYLSDWEDGFRFKSVSAILFLYLVCLAPVIAFGGLASSLTAGNMGVIEFIISSGVSGMIYALFSAQPLTFVAPTGLTLAFITALYSFCRVYSLPFLSIYAWVGIWTSMILFMASITNASDLIKYCTRFTDDVFNSLIATNFLYEAARSLIIPFLLCGANKTAPFTAAALAIGTYLTGRALTGLRTSRFLVKRARDLLADYGPVLAIVSMSALAAVPAIAKVGLEKVAIPPNFALAGGRAFLIPLMTVPLSLRFATIVPAILLTCLFLLDQNISSRVVNSPAHNLKKGVGYHLDMLILSICTFLTSIVGLPWMCAGTVQSLTHVRALSEVETRNGKEVIVSVQENRVTPFAVHAALLSSLLLLPLIERIPMAVVSGLFLFLGARMMMNNEFLSRIRYLFMDPKMYPEDSPMQVAPTMQVHGFTMMQCMCLAMLWVLKLNKRTSMFFPAVIATLMFIRSIIAPRLFPETTLSTLDSEIVETEKEVPEEVHASDRKLSPAN